MIKNKISLPTAALIAGFGLLTMVVAAPLAEIYAFPKIFVPDKPDETIKHILEKRSLFVLCITGYLITFICDIVVAWALYILLKPVNEDVSLLTALFRLVYSVIAIIALLYLVSILKLTNSLNLRDIPENEKLYIQTETYFRAFKDYFHFGILFFSIHLLLLSGLVFLSKYIPKILGILLLISGIGYMLTALKPIFFPGINIDFAVYTFYGEIIFMLWLLIRGRRIKNLTSTGAG